MNIVIATYGVSLTSKVTVFVISSDLTGFVSKVYGNLAGVVGTSLKTVAGKVRRCSSGLVCY